MSHILIVLLKLICAFCAFALDFDFFYHSNIMECAGFSLLFAVASYIGGDQFLLPRIGNSNTILLDFFLAYVSVWLYGLIFKNNYLQTAWDSMISALVIAAGEVFIHRHMIKNYEGQSVGIQEETRGNPQLVFGVEMAEEQNSFQKTETNLPKL